MTDLDHWQFTDAFTGMDAAHLIVGLDPKNLGGDAYKAELAYSRLKAAYSLAVEFHSNPMTSEEQAFYPNIIDAADSDKPAEPRVPERAKIFGRKESVKFNGIVGRFVTIGMQIGEIDPNALQSIEMEPVRYVSDGVVPYIEPIIEGIAASAWLKCDHSNFENQTFSRKELHRWLQAIGLNSEYPFLPLVSPEIASRSDATIWPSHETHKLRALRMAAVKFWSGYTASDPTTAPTNEQVSEYLQRIHGISASLADAMATILRADDLKTGPRPK